MFDSNNNCLIYDWQTLVPDHPILDLAMIVCTGVNPENIQDWIEELLGNYYRKFESTLLKCEITEVPFSLEELSDLFFKTGIFMSFLITIENYEEIYQYDEPSKQRFLWQLQQSIKAHPEFFQ